jgi:hypothetical protein
MEIGWYTLEEIKWYTMKEIDWYTMEEIRQMGGRADFKTFQIYIRMAGIDVKGVTDNFRVMPEMNLGDNILKLGN